MRVLLLLSLLAIAHEGLSKEIETTPEDEFDTAVEHRIASARLTTLVSAGKTTDACVKGGQSAINEVLREKNSAQKILYKMRNGSKCKSKRSRNVRAARERVSASRIALRTAKGNLSRSLAKKVKVSIKFSVGNKNCNNFYKTRSWKSHRALVKKLKRMVSSAKAKLSSAKSGLVIALRAQLKAQCRCKRKVINQANAALVKAMKLTTARKRTIRREELLICLAKVRGKKNAHNLGNRCKNASLPAKYNSKLKLQRTKLVKMSFRCKKKNQHMGAGARKTSDSCKGFFIPKSCNGHIAFELQKRNTWSRNAKYTCPLGWKWASRAEYNATWRKVRGRGFGGKYGSCNGYGYYGKCGWGGYPSPNKYYFRFSDSHKTCSYKHAGNYIAVTGTTCSTSYNGGIVCIKQ